MKNEKQNCEAETQRQNERTQRSKAIEFAERQNQPQKNRELNNLFWERNNVWREE